MRTFKIIFIFIVLTAGTLLGIKYVWPQLAKHDEVHKDIYTCPMHPQIIRDRPGECPICHMKLVKKIEVKDIGATRTTSDQEKNISIAGYAPISISDDQRKLMGVRTWKVEKKPISKAVRAFGFVASNLEMYKIQNEFVDAYTEYVNTFQDYRRIKDRRRNWEIHRNLQTRLLESNNKLLQLGLSEAEILKLQKINRWQIWNQPQLALFQDNPNYWIIAEVAENEIGFIDVAQKAEVEISAYHEKVEGIVRSVGGAIDPESRRVRVLIELPEYKGELIANMFAVAAMQVELNESLLVPQEAVMDLGTRKVVFVEPQAGIFEPREIEVDWQAGGLWSIKKGIKEGESVVVDGNFLIDSESRLKASYLSATGQSTTGGAAHVH